LSRVKSLVWSIDVSFAEVTFVQCPPTAWTTAPFDAFPGAPTLVDATLQPTTTATRRTAIAEPTSAH
jgi:hypothetical protein